MKLKFRSLLPAFALALTAAATVIPAHAALVLRGANNEMVYDTVANLTWIRDAGLGGQQDWASAKDWADNLVFGGRDDWRLPGLTPVNGAALNLMFSDDGSTDVGFNTAGMNSELGYLFYQSLGNTNASGLANTGPFDNFDGFWAYWTGAESPVAGEAMSFFTFGDQESMDKGNTFYAWAVRAGDTPEPGSVALVLGALGALALARRKSAASSAR